MKPFYCQPTVVDGDEEGELEPQDAELESIDTRVDKLVGQSKTDSNPDILTNIAQEFAIKETTGEEVNKSLADIVSSLVKDRLPEDKLKQKLQKYPRPVNIEGLKTPWINPLIWGQISSNTQQSDAIIAKRSTHLNWRRERYCKGCQSCFKSRQQ